MKSFWPTGIWLETHLCSAASPAATGHEAATLETYKHLASATILMTWSLAVLPDKIIIQDGR